jgi:hypothetical protein
LIDTLTQQRRSKKNCVLPFFGQEVESHWCRKKIAASRG